MEPNRILAGMSLSLPTLQKLETGIPYKLPVDYTLYSLGIESDPLFCRFKITQPFTAVTIHYNLIYTSSSGVRLDPALHVGLRINGDIVSSLAQELFYIDETYSGIRGTLTSFQDFSLGDQVQVVLINQGIVCSLEYKSALVTIYNGALPSASSSSTQAYTHEQKTPSTLWKIPHHLGFNPSVLVFSSLGQQCDGAIALLDKDNLQITFNNPLMGKAYLS